MNDGIYFGPGSRWLRSGARIYVARYNFLQFGAWLAYQDYLYQKESQMFVPWSFHQGGYEETGAGPYEGPRPNNQDNVDET